MSVNPERAAAQLIGLSLSSVGIFAAAISHNLLKRDKLFSGEKSAKFALWWTHMADFYPVVRKNILQSLEERIAERTAKYLQQNDARKLSEIFERFGAEYIPNKQDLIVVYGADPIKMELMQNIVKSALAQYLKNPRGYMVDKEKLAKELCISYEIDFAEVEAMAKELSSTQ